MDREQALGRRLRLQHELAEAYTAAVCQSGRIERLSDELAVAYRQLESDVPRDEQSSDPTVPGISVD